MLFVSVYLLIYYKKFSSSTFEVYAYD